MPDSANPYIPGQPVDNPRLFFGRREVLASIREHLVKGRRVFLVSGAARMGKSSLLRQVPHHLPEEFFPVRLDLAEEEVQHLDWLLWRLADAIGNQVSQQLGVSGLEATWADFEGQTGVLVERFWPRVRQALGDRCLVLLLDDLDCLAEAKGNLLEYFITILATWRDRDDDLALVLTMSVAGQEAMVREHPRLLGGALSYLLGPLESEMASRLITWPVDGVLTYDYGVARRLIEVTSGQPYYLQLVCFEVFNRCSAAGWVNQRDVELVIEDLVRREISDFRQMWDESSGREQAVLAALVSLRGARGIATVQEVRTSLHKAGARVSREQVVEALDRLTERGILERLGALSYRFRVALLRDWLGERLELPEVVRGTRWDAGVSPKAASGQRVRKLATRKERRARAASRPRGEVAEAGSAEEQKPAAASRNRLWIAPVVVLGAVLLLVAGPRLFQALSPDPTPTATLQPSPTPRLLTATLPQAALASTKTATAAPPTATPRPVVTETPSPTPPLVVARSLPSIAYQSRGPGDKQWFVYVMNSDGSNRTPLTEGQAGFLAPPSWAPDGVRIAFVSDRSGNPDIWVMDRDGGNLANLTQNQAKDHSPAWSPDGDWIAFASVRDSVYWELYLMRPDGSDVQRLTWWEDASDLSPSWSPDGSRIAFASKRDGNWEIYAMDRDGSNLVRLTSHPADDTNPAWSPDGSRIAFESTRDGYADIFIMPAIGGEGVNISNAPFSSEHGPTWSPDGGRLAFYSDRDGDWDIFVMASDGSDVVQLTGGNTNDQVPAWRP
jgi:Tol biopolymer transport system component